ncbi:MAG: YHS domain-containing protein [Oligoflexia bacterium]|nr:YHS domain-containing protein [Oligoflexia bacterium]
MRNKFKILFILSIVLLLSSNLLAQTSANEGNKKDKATSNSKEAAPSKMQTKCPVLEGTIDKKLFVDYKGKRIYFCCAGCEKDFNKDPEKYLKKMKADGIKVEDIPSEKK